MSAYLKPREIQNRVNPRIWEAMRFIYHKWERNLLARAITCIATFCRQGRESRWWVRGELPGIYLGNCLMWAMFFI